MNIYFIGQKGVPAVGGGVEQYVDSLAVRLAAMGHAVYVYTRWNYSDRTQKMYRGVHLINLPSLPTKQLDAISHTLLASLHVLFRRADIIHYHSIGPSSLLWIPKLFKRTTAVVATFQSQCYQHQKWGAFARRYLRMGERILCRWADAVIVPSQKLQRYAREQYRRDTVRIPNGISLPAQPGVDQLHHWGLEKNGYVLVVSRLVRHKGLHYLIEAFKGMEMNKKLVIVGDGAFTDDYVAELHELARSDAHIILTGAQHGSALEQLYAHAAVFVQPSESEGLSIALLEAMSHGLPIVASDIEENREAVGTAAVTFATGNVAALREALQRVIEETGLSEQLRADAYERARTQFDWNTLVVDVVNVYYKALQIKSPGISAHTAVSSGATSR